MSTKKPKPDPEQDIGHPDAVDFYPRIVWAAHIMDGQPHLRGTDVPLTRILRTVADYARLPEAPVLSALVGHPIREAEVRTVLLFSADMMEHLSAMDAELARRMARIGRKRKSTRKRKDANHEGQERNPTQEADPRANGAAPSDHDPNTTRQ